MATQIEKEAEPSPPAPGATPRATNSTVISPASVPLRLWEGIWQHWGFPIVLGAYLTLLSAFVAWVSLHPSTFFVLLGTFVFSVTSAFIAMFRFSRDLEASTRRQISHLGDSTEKQIEKANQNAQRYVEALRASTQNSITALEAQTGRTVERLEDLSLQLKAVTEAIAASADKMAGIQKEQLAKSNEALEVERERLQTERESANLQRQKVDNDRAAEAARIIRLTPRLQVRVGEANPLGRSAVHFFAWLTVPPVEARFELQGQRAGTQVSGPKITPPAMTSPKHDMEIHVAQVYWRWNWQTEVFDSVGFEIHLLTQDLRKLVGRGNIPVSQGEWREVALVLE